METIFTDFFSAPFMTEMRSAGPETTSLILVTTCLATAAGADQMSPGVAIIICLISGMLVVFSAVTLDRYKLDDCVGAVSVHLVCGIFGTLEVSTASVVTPSPTMSNSYVVDF